MKRKRLSTSLWIVCAGFAALLSQSPVTPALGSMLALSFPRVGLSAHEWVGGYQCSLQGVRIVAIREIPYIWTIGVTNSRGGRAEVDSAHVLGTGPMGKDPIEELRELFVLKPTTRADKARPLSVNCKLYVENFHNDDVKFVKLDTKQVSIEPVDAIPSPEPPYKPDLKLFAVSIPAFALAHNERIVTLEVEIRAGRVVSVKNIPDLWFVSATNNDAGSFTGVYGEPLADSAALGKNDLDMFDRFVTIELQGDFEIRVKLKVETAPRHYRYVRFDTRQLILTPVSYSGKRTNQAP